MSLWIKAILGILAASPKLLDYIEQLSLDVSAWLAERRRQEALAAEQKAAEESKQSKDSSALEKLFDPDKK